ncbi:putative reverse transcriptase zinc-binding domain-containing protein [Helianthus annuus]|uniref:Reverse transcriptase zinc-binding domain-containing protein n=1 Tax=Helianthus annuus TaxID=4232 RepID=A0A9K3EF39_HELAN|nr:putative reverse transcriptase zinc-binding domain-containing protein [Helianthus annuus]KAJ0847727.1 putative reverse transcriptase zinc-binding domain-containing protein [Helianthus annuus]
MDTELKEWQECVDVLSLVRLSNDSDSWFWNVENQAGFSVSSVKKERINDRGNSGLPNFEWCKWIPIKCNIMAWRANLDRLATKVNLKRRNVDIPSVMCPFYDEYEESVDHLFTACSLASRVWTAVSAWCNIPPIFAFAFKDLLDIHNSGLLGKKAKKIMLGLVISTVWCIWKARNDLVFNQIRRSPQEIVSEVKSRVMLGLKIGLLVNISIGRSGVNIRCICCNLVALCPFGSRVLCLLAFCPFASEVCF